MIKTVLGLWAATAALAPVAAPVRTVDFQLPDVNGVMHRLSDYRGKWVVVNYWATWCPPCLEEMPELERFHQGHKDKDAVVLGVNLEATDAATLRYFLKWHLVSYPILRKAPGLYTELGRVPGMPTSFLVAPDGRLVARRVGSVTAAELEAFIGDPRRAGPEF